MIWFWALLPWVVVAALVWLWFDLRRMHREEMEYWKRGIKPWVDYINRSVNE